MRKVAERVLSALGAEGSELSLSIVGDRAIRIINREYLAKDRPTNVISFSLREGEFGHLNPEMLGDVVISADTAAREADDAGIPFYERFCFLLLHGILHLSGYDHERSGEKEAARMEAKEQELFQLLRQEGLIG
ncbi:rRNA maturation RNase YbeY [Geobacter sp. OR-1]|uniref:rRNA maturation RNase YbeY n=1 Tax=Geobacter sp. OR-1 TaxID=1266765 RepID=UPI00351C9464